MIFKNQAKIPAVNLFRSRRYCLLSQTSARLTRSDATKKSFVSIVLREASGYSKEDIS